MYFYFRFIYWVGVCHDIATRTFRLFPPGSKTLKDDYEGVIGIPREYKICAKSLIDVFREETFPHGTAVNSRFSENTESALSSLINILIPKNAVHLDEHIDPELFLLALYKAYTKNFALFRKWNQRDAFCGIIRPAKLSPI
jgi:hypothetical protein